MGREPLLPKGIGDMTFPKLKLKCSATWGREPLLPKGIGDYLCPLPGLALVVLGREPLLPKGIGDFASPPKVSVMV